MKPTKSILLAVAACLLILFLVVLNWSHWTSARHRMHRKACISNLIIIDGAKQLYIRKHTLPIGADVSFDDIAAYLPPRKLTCPAGGYYSVNAVGVDPRCSYRDGAASAEGKELPHALEE